MDGKSTNSHAASGTPAGWPPILGSIAEAVATLRIGLALVPASPAKGRPTVRWPPFTLSSFTGAHLFTLRSARPYFVDGAGAGAIRASGDTPAPDNGDEPRMHRPGEKGLSTLLVRRRAGPVEQHAQLPQPPAQAPRDHYRSRPGRRPHGRTRARGTRPMPRAVSRRAACRRCRMWRPDPREGPVPAPRSRPTGTRQGRPSPPPDCQEGNAEARAATACSRVVSRAPAGSSSFMATSLRGRFVHAAPARRRVR